ncbi:MAG: anthranilate synthase component I, partial [Pseudomonadota bacterium]
MKLSCYPGRDEFCDLAKKGNVIPVCLEVLADTETPVSLLLKKYRKGSPIFLLESVEGGERWGRYSFLGTRARYDVRVFPEALLISGAGGELSIEHHGDPNAALREFMARF